MSDSAAARKRHQLLAWRRRQLPRIARVVADRGDVRLIASPADIVEADDGVAVDDVDDLPSDAGL